MFNNQILAAKLLETGAVRIRPDDPFTWASGLRSPIYCDNRILLSHPEIRSALIELMVKVAKDFEIFNTIAGVATAGIPHGVLLADRLGKPFIYVRSKPKEHGRQNMIEGELPEKARVLVIEDLISTGMSSLQAVEAVRTAGATVVGVLAVFQYGLPVAQRAFDQAQCPFATLTDYPTVVRVAAEKGLIAASALDLLQSWASDPKAWSDHYIATHSA